jgi:hypothetical protein
MILIGSIDRAYATGRQKFSSVLKEPRPETVANFLGILIVPLVTTGPLQANKQQCVIFFQNRLERYHFRDPLLQQNLHTSGFTFIQFSERAHHNVHMAGTPYLEKIVIVSACSEGRLALKCQRLRNQTGSTFTCD